MSTLIFALDSKQQTYYGDSGSLVLADIDQSCTCS